jgi:hypothetical protein
VSSLRRRRRRGGRGGFKAKSVNEVDAQLGGHRLDFWHSLGSQCVKTGPRPHSGK